MNKSKHQPGVNARPGRATRSTVDPAYAHTGPDSAVPETRPIYLYLRLSKYGTYMLSAYRRVLIRLSASEAPIAADMMLTATQPARMKVRISIGMMGDRPALSAWSAVAIRVYTKPVTAIARIDAVTATMPDSTTIDPTTERWRAPSLMRSSSSFRRPRTEASVDWARLNSARIAAPPTIVRIAAC